MSDLFQSGHPDADQLSAFAEHALPPHEQQQTLAHLAVCPECRAVVSLSLPPAAQLAHPLAEPARKPHRFGWFSGWKFAWPVAAAFATLIPVILYVHHAATPHNNPAAPPQLAESQPPAAPPPAAPAPPSATKPQPPRPAAAPANPSTAIRKTPAAADQPQPAAPAAATATPNESSNQAAMASNSPPATPRSSFSGGGGGGIMGGIGGSPSFRADAAYSPMATPPPPSAAPPVTSAAAAPSLPSAAPPAAAPSQASNQAAAAEAKNQALAANRDANQDQAAFARDPTVSVTSALAVQTLRARIVQAPLPSGLPVLSTASSGRLALALDTGNALFVSSDGGRNWQPVSRQWRGRAVSVKLANTAGMGGGLGMAALRGANSGTPAITGAALNPIDAVALSAQPAPASPASSRLAGAVTDPTGAFIPNASVMVIDAAKQTAIASVTTDSAGHYRIDGLAPGNYRIVARARGFERLELPITLAAARRNPVNLTLQVSAATETITVTAAPAIALDDSASDQSAAIAASVPAAAAGKSVPPAASIPLPPLFEMTTENGDRWTSADGQTWKRR